MKCENCSHAEMCKWIDELEGRGCDFCDEKPCELLILKSDILLYQEDKKKWAESIKQEKKNGVIILPPYFTPLLIPNDVEIRIEQEPCEWGRMTFDATSGTSVFEFSDGTIKQVKQAELEQCEDAISREDAIEALTGWETEPTDEEIEYTLNKLPSVTQKCEKCAMNGSGSKYCDNCKPKGHWIVLPPIYEEICECSSCHKRFKQALQIGNKPCPNCGAKMVELQESEE